MSCELRMDRFADLSFFALVAKSGSLAKAAQELGLTPPAASKRLAAIERRLGVRLLQRTTRRLSLTPEGETYLHDGLRVRATLGFGRRHVAPALSRFARDFPEVEVQLHLSDRPVNLVEQGFDLQVR